VGLDGVVGHVQDALGFAGAFFAVNFP